VSSCWWRFEESKGIEALPSPPPHSSGERSRTKLWENVRYQGCHSRLQGEDWAQRLRQMAVPTIPTPHPAISKVSPILSPVGLGIRQRKTDHSAVCLTYDSLVCHRRVLPAFHLAKSPKSSVVMGQALSVYRGAPPERQRPPRQDAIDQAWIDISKAKGLVVIM